LTHAIHTTTAWAAIRIGAAFTHALLRFATLTCTAIGIAGAFCHALTRPADQAFALVGAIHVGLAFGLHFATAVDAYVRIIVVLLTAMGVVAAFLALAIDAYFAFIGAMGIFVAFWVFRSRACSQQKQAAEQSKHRDDIPTVSLHERFS